MEIKTTLLPGVIEAPRYIRNSSGFDLRVHSFKRLFKGNCEVDLTTKLQQSVKDGKVLLRPFERMIVGTGIIMELPIGVLLSIVNKPQRVIDRGLTVLSSPIDNNYRGEIDIILYNGSQFMNEVVMNTVVARGILSEYMKGEFII